MCVTQYSILDLLSREHQNSLASNESVLATSLSSIEVPQQVCFLDELGESCISPQDIDRFKYIIVGG